MRVERVCVRRLRSMGYSNAAVELCAAVGEDDRLDDVVRHLQVMAEAYVDQQFKIADLEEYMASVKRLASRVEELKRELEEQEKKLEEEYNELIDLLDKLREAESSAAEAKTILHRIKEKLKVKG